MTLWTAGGTQLATTTVTGTGTEGFDFASITPLALTAGTDYVIGANTLSDNYADNGATFTAAADINYIVHREVSCAGVTPCFPTNSITSFDDFGANFQFRAVPEPASIMMFGTGLLLLGLLGWRKKSSIR